MSAPANKRARDAAIAPVTVERVQTGVRLEKRMLKVLKALAEVHDLSLGDLLEGIVPVSYTHLTLPTILRV